MSDILKAPPDTLTLVIIASLVVLAMKLVDYIVSKKRNGEGGGHRRISAEDYTEIREELIKTIGILTEVGRRQERIDSDVLRARDRMLEISRALDDARAKLESIE